MTIVICMFCSSKFDKKPSQIRLRKQHFCSVSCANNFAHERSIITLDRACLFCEKTFPVQTSKDYGQKFCSHTCSARFHNRSRTRHFCMRCRAPTHSSRQDFCSTTCREQHLLEEWLAGRLEGGTKYGYVKAFVRRYLEQRAHNECEQCPFDKLHPLDGRSILQVDHIDGDCMNNAIQNLRLLCPNCHAMTDTYGGRNKQSGRSWKKLYHNKQ